MKACHATGVECDKEACQYRAQCVRWELQQLGMPSAGARLGDGVPMLHLQYPLSYGTPPSYQNPGIPLGTPLGWMCPRCSRCFAPSVQSCGFCGPKTEARTDAYQGQR